jgi:hypothetical protein
MAVKKNTKGWLYYNPLTADPNDMFLRIQSEGSLGIDDVSKSACSRGGAQMSPDTMTQAVTLWLREMAFLASGGFLINVGWFIVQAVVRGVFRSPAERFDRARHTLAFDFRQGALMRKEAQDVNVQILGVASTGASIAQVTDVRTGSVNDLLTPGRNLRITGTRLRIAGEDPENGVWFICYETGARTRVEDPDLAINNPAELMVIIPELTEGTYRLQITTQFGSAGSQLVKEPRTVIFDRILTVE